MPSEVSTAGAAQRRRRTVEELERELAEAHLREAATADVLKVISRSTVDLQTVLDAVAESAARVCGAKDAQIFRIHDDSLRMVASFGRLPVLDGFEEGIPINRDWVTGRSVVDQGTVQVRDLAAESETEFPQGSDYARRFGHRTTLATPLVREGTPIGAILIRRNEVRSFSDRQIKLLETFADQAVIAIENARLFHEVQARTQELTEALEQQTATAEILRVISSSPTDTQPVFDTIMQSAVRLCGARYALVYRLEGEMVQLVGHHNFSPEALEPFRRTLPHRLSDSGTLVAQAMISGEVVVIDDIEHDPGVSESVRELARSAGYRSVIAVPMMRDGRPLGAVALTRSDELGGPQPFSREEIKLLEMFAEHVGIAIENTRLFEAEQASKRDLQESLEYQTATSHVLGVISRSPHELQPVLDAITKTAAQLCEADYAHLRILRHGAYHVAANHGHDERTLARMIETPILPGVDSVAGRAALECATVHITNIMNSPTGTYSMQINPRSHTALGVPLVKDGVASGVIVLFRKRVLPFADRQIDLVKTFADQALIAIENTRLFEEVQARTRELTESLEYQTATSEVLGVISRSAFDLQTVLDTLIEAAARLCGARQAVLRRREGDSYTLAATYGIKPEWRGLIAGHRNTPGQGTLVGRVAVEKRTLQIPDVFADPEFPNRETAVIVGFRSVVGTPLLRDGDQIGFISLHKETPGPFTAKQVQLLENFADQAVIAIENARLFEEVQARTRELARSVEELEIASQHKSQFVANMSHELRTPLAAILGYAELMQEGFYEPLGKKSLDALTRIQSNGKHLLGLINTVLDIAKIESGQFSLNIAEYAIESVVETVRVATESLAETKKLSLKTDVAKKLPVGLGDEQRLTQVLLNLVGNAIKFTNAGEVRITATATNSHFTVAVTDTGPGIPAEELKRVFEQFHQIDNSNTKAKGGTGLGLAIAKQIVEMHGGRIWVESTLGKGATFQMELPVRAEDRKGAS